MAQYLLYGSITYSTVANRNTGLAAIQSVADTYSAYLTPANAGPYASGAVSNPSGNVVSFAYLLDDETQANAVREAFRAAWTSATKTAATVSMVKIT